MKNIFGQIIFLLTFLTGLPALAQMSCDGAGNCTGTYSFPGSGGNLGAFMPPPVSSGIGGNNTMSPEAARQRACAAAKGPAEAARGKCLWQASDKRDKAIAKCPQDTEVVVGIPGVITATTTPRASCIEAAAGVKATDELKCQSDYLNAPIPYDCPK